MRVLIITQYFWPETFLINNVAIGLKERGHEVIVLTGKPNYPTGTIFKGYNYFKKSCEVWNGITINRVPLIARGKGKGVRLFLNYISFAISASVKILFIKKNFDVAFVFAPSPITVGVPAFFLQKIYNKPFHIWVQDLWPASIMAASQVKNKYVINIFEILTRQIYNSSSTVLVQSNAFIPYITNQGIKATKILYLPNFAEPFIRSMSTKKLEEFNIPKGFNLLFAGNIGNAQSFDTLISAAKILKKRNKKINWIILGEGRVKKEVQKKVNDLDLNDCFYFLGKFPVSDMPSFYDCADALLLSLKKSDIFSLTIPSKLQGYMSFGKLIIASLDGECGRIIKSANAGFVSPAEDAISLAENIIRATELDFDTKNKMALNASAYYHKEFDRETFLNKLEKILLNF